MQVLQTILSHRLSSNLPLLLSACIRQQVMQTLQTILSHT